MPWGWLFRKRKCVPWKCPLKLFHYRLASSKAVGAMDAVGGSQQSSGRSGGPSSSAGPACMLMYLHWACGTAYFYQETEWVGVPRASRRHFGRHLRVLLGRLFWRPPGAVRRTGQTACRAEHRHSCRPVALLRSHVHGAPLGEEPTQPPALTKKGQPRIVSDIQERVPAQHQRLPAPQP